MARAAAAAQGALPPSAPALVPVLHPVDVGLALAQHAKGVSSALYGQLLAYLAQCDEVAQLVSVLSEIAQHGALVTQHHERFDALLSVLFVFDWQVPDDSVSTAFEDVLASFASSHAGFNEPAFELLVGNFVRLPEDPKQREWKLTCLHSAVQRLLRLNPLACAALLPVLVGRFPSVHADETVLKGYLHESLRVCEYLPILGDKVLFVAIDRLLELDGEVAALADADLFRMDDTEVVVGTKRARTCQDEEALDKADALLCELMLHCSKCSRSLFKQILSVFDQLILRTGRARTAQFLVFFAARQKPSVHCDALISLLLMRMTERHEPASVRKQAAAFLGSFIARSRFIPSSSVKSALHHSTAWLLEEAERLRGRKESRDVFDAGFQAVVYALLYKHAQVGGLDFMRGLGWDRLVSSPLAPMERLSKDVAQMYYLHLAAAVPASITGMDPEEPPRHYTPPPACAQELAETFPFDPLLLPKARLMVADMYQEWDLEPDEDLDAELEEEFNDDVDEDAEESGNEALLQGEGLPAPVRIAAIRRMLGIAGDVGEDDFLSFPSPMLRPVSAQMQLQLSNGLAGSW